MFKPSKSWHKFDILSILTLSGNQRVQMFSSLYLKNVYSTFSNAHISHLKFLCVMQKVTDIQRIMFASV